ncbi:unnamed protein product [Polarella glacialis]|uniref:Uncharacterized protein n=1 Tax=Polarella glacialis TaxID=89957 RepID=A0A813LNG7_POLGL|nr:unnamed protein product [Polarella glacialis]
MAALPRWANLNKLFPEVKVANTFIHVESEDVGAAVARRSQSCPPRLFKVISSSKQQPQPQPQPQPQQQKEAGRPEAKQESVASAKHVGLASPSRLSAEQKLQAQGLIFPSFGLFKTSHCC